MKYLILFATTIFFISCSHHIKLFNTKIKNKKLTLQTIENYSKNSSSDINLTIREKTFSGFAACNDYNGTFSINKDYVYFKLDSVGTKVCEDLEDQTKYLHNLVKTATIVIQGKKVYFKDKDEAKLLMFTRK